MKKHKLEAFTEEQKNFAECNHKLVYKYLSRHGYSIEEFYNIAIDGYLKAVQIFHVRKELQSKYDFAFIASQYMRAEISNHFKTVKACKRIPSDIVVSLDSELDDMEGLYNTIGGKSAESDAMDKILIENFLERLSDVQKEILLLRVEGYNNKEMCARIGLKESTFYKELHYIKEAASELIAC